MSGASEFIMIVIARSGAMKQYIRRGFAWIASFRSQ
jgi:hypothetical protein